MLYVPQHTAQLRIINLDSQQNIEPFTVTKLSNKGNVQLFIHDFWKIIGLKKALKVGHNYDYKNALF